MIKYLFLSFIIKNLENLTMILLLLKIGKLYKNWKINNLKKSVFYKM